MILYFLLSIKLTCFLGWTCHLKHGIFRCTCIDGVLVRWLLSMKWVNEGNALNQGHQWYLVRNARKLLPSSYHQLDWWTQTGARNGPQQMSDCPKDPQPQPCQNGRWSDWLPKLFWDYLLILFIFFSIRSLMVKVTEPIHKFYGLFACHIFVDQIEG